MSQNVPEFAWNTGKTEAAQLLAEGKLSDEEIAVRAGVTRRQLSRWKQHPDFKAKIAEHVKEIEAAILSHGIARRTNRIRALDSRWEKMQAVIAARSADPSHQTAAGGDTGLLVRTEKVIGTGPAAEKVEEFAVDTALLRELREHEKQAAQELGQWTEKHDHTSGGEPFKVYVGIDMDKV